MKYIYYWLRAFGINPIDTFRGVVNMPMVILDYLRLRSQNIGQWKINFSMPICTDKDPIHDYDSHYLLQDLLVAQKIYQRKPQNHLDVGSRLDGFITHVATFMPIDVYDIRKPDIPIPNVNYSPDPAQHYKSVSCLHSMEHWGLGRYGDKVELFGYLWCLCYIDNHIEPDGTLYLSVPVGEQRIEFNAHRIFAKETILNTLKENYTLTDYTELGDRPDYKLGIFEFKRNGDTIL